ncbi:MAG: hypothetical protein UT48_C0012G0010 [Parcubacteria group bacterium GW2011_GWE2_39_37]|uniref:ASCH domain-containing protein n=1 Tax=Candidatus Falkowbacteria bacterium GW2011_GWF2_39_8 TaxID=1618642 RepID=A0A0G0T304_9BACT|nr:MAG: hypothetical protein UT48_C0012G0010 [Parcubacteria group bacterium GW2011_GWE2_39_37]KKR32187.1 MAG: hypothetical protein UT64_C0040G0010 [Candidatus Falkowbacteria bacterium GW2011_GWF2_39_8]
MVIHQMKLAKAPFEKIINGKKIIESRLFDEKRQRIKVGDLIEFVNNDDQNIKITTKVLALYKYNSFEELFSNFPPAYFGGDSKEYLIQEIHEFYSLADENEYGVVGIKFIKE